MATSSHSRQSSNIPLLQPLEVGSNVWNSLSVQLLAGGHFIFQGIESSHLPPTRLSRVLCRFMVIGCVSLEDRDRITPRRSPGEQLSFPGFIRPLQLIPITSAAPAPGSRHRRMSRLFFFEDATSPSSYWARDLVVIQILSKRCSMSALDRFSKQREPARRAPVERTEILMSINPDQEYPLLI